MAENKLITVEQTAALIGKTIKNLEIDIDLSDYQTKEAAGTLKSEIDKEIAKKVDTETYNTKIGEIEEALDEKADQSDLESLQSDLTSKLTAVYRYKGSKSSYDQLPEASQNEVGDVWDVNNGMNYAWNGSAWDALGDSRIEIDAALSDTSTNAVQNKVVKKAIDDLGEAQKKFVAKTDLASDSENGLMSSDDFTKLKGIEPGANNFTLPNRTDGMLSIGLYRFSTDAHGFVDQATAVTKQDIIDLGISDKTYSVFNGTTDGLVPHPTTSTETRYLREDGKWEIPQNTTYEAISTTDIDALFN